MHESNEFLVPHYKLILILLDAVGTHLFKWILTFC